MTVEPVSPPSTTVPAGDAAARPAARTRLARRVLDVPPSGIRKFFDVLATMPDVISLGVGEPDFTTPPQVVEEGVRSLRSGRTHYTSNYGTIELRRALARHLEKLYGVAYDPDKEILVTVGASEALGVALAAILDPGDEVIVPAPYWTTYPESIRLAGGVPVDVVADETTGYRVSVEQLEAARTENTKVLLFVSPSNPTGAVYTREQIEEIGRWAAEKGLWVLTDEIYEHLVYGDAEFHSLPVVVPELRDKCIVVNGVAKTYAMTGWRVGWVIGPKDVVKAATNLQSHATSNVSNVAQVAADGGERRTLRDVGHVGRRVRLQVGRRLDDVRGADEPAHPPAGHGIGLGDSVDHDADVGELRHQCR